MGSLFLVFAKPLAAILTALVGFVTPMGVARTMNMRDAQLAHPKAEAGAVIGGAIGGAAFGELKIEELELEAIPDPQEDAAPADAEAEAEAEEPE